MAFPSRRLVVSAVGATVVALLAAAAVVEHRAGVAWSAMAQQTVALRAAFERREFTRAPCWGDSEPGSAFAHYERAVALAKPLAAADHTELVATLRRSDAEVASGTVALRARWRPALEALRAGAHHLDARPTHAPDGDAHAVASLLPCRWLANAAVFEARALRHAGRGREAVEWTLDALTFGVDHVRHGVLIDQMIGLALVAIPTACWDDAALHALDAGALELLDDGLARLDGLLPPRLDTSAELLWCAEMFQRAPTAETSGTPSAAAWRFGFSQRWMIADALAHYAAATAAIATPPQPQPWGVRQRALAAAFAEFPNADNPVLRLLAPNLGAAEANLREVVAKLRLLRAAARLERGLEADPLPDPLGDGPLAVHVEADGVRLRSVGLPQGRPCERFVRRR